MEARGVTAEGRAKFRKLVFDVYGYEVHEPAVAAFHESRARTKIISCPARTSKSYAGWKDMLPDVLAHGPTLALNPDLETQRGWIVAPNFSLAAEFSYAWEDLVERKDQAGFPYSLGRCKNSPKQGDMEIELIWGKNAKGQDVRSIIEVKTAQNEKTLQSQQLDWVIMSEAARLDSIVWFKYLSTRTGRSVWPTTPDIQAAWIYELIQQGEENPALGTEHFRFTGRANPKFDWQNFWIEHAKAELQEENEIVTTPLDDQKSPSLTNGHDCFDETAQCSAMKQDGFAEQFGGRWVFHRGRIVPIRETTGEKGQPAHVINYDLGWFKHADLHVSFDYGYADGTCIQFWLVGPRQVVLRKSIYEKGLVPDDIVSKVLSTINWFEREYDQSNMLRRLVGDPKKPEVAELFRRRGLPIWDVDKKAQVDRKAGHMEFMNYLKIDPATNEPGMLIHAENVDVIKEWRTLRRNDRVRSEDSTTAFIGADHAYDAARYFLMCRPVAFDNDFAAPVSDFERYRLANVERVKRRQRATVKSGYGHKRVGGLSVASH